MAGLFSTPHSYDSNFIEGTVTNVDPIRFVCSVRTNRGQFFPEVPWLLPTGGSGKSGMHFSPSVGDQVVINTSLSYPIIIGALPRLGLPETELTNVSGATGGVDAGNASNIKNGYSTNPNKPSDFLPGDHVITTEGGGIFAMLANGTALIKASPLAQIVISKYDDLVRVMARNWERFSDLGQQTVANVKGRMYEFVGWDRDFSRSQNSIYELKDIIGDVVAGEVMRGEPNPDQSVPAKDSRVRKYSLENTSGSELMVETLTDDGKIVVVVHNGGTTTTTHDNSKFEAHVLNGTYSVITILPGSILIDHNNVSKVLLDDTKVDINHKGVSIGTFDDNQVSINHNGAVTVLDDSGIRSDFSGHFVHVDSSGVHLG